MDTYIKKEQFVGRLALDFGNYSGFDDYAAQIQEETLLTLLGYATYKDFDANPTEPEYTNLLNGVEWTDSAGVLHKAAGITTMLPYFFYFYYSRDVQSFNTTLGEFESLAENAQPADRARLNSRLVNNYNKGLEYYYQLVAYMEQAPADYPNVISQVLEQQNVFGI